MKKNGLTILFLLTTVLAAGWGYQQMQKADEWELKAYKMGEQAAEYKKILETNEKQMIEATIQAELRAEETLKKVQQYKSKK